MHTCRRRRLRCRHLHRHPRLVPAPHTASSLGDVLGDAVTGAADGAFVGSWERGDLLGDNVGLAVAAHVWLASYTSLPADV